MSGRTTIEPWLHSRLIVRVGCRPACWLGVAAILLALALTGCGPSAKREPTATSAPSKPFTAVATVGMIADIVRNVAGDRADVIGIIGAGVDPHLYKPTRRDVVRLSEADIVFYNGLMLEGKMGDVLVRLARGGKPVYAVTEAILEQGDYVMANEAQHYDPHVWMDVGGWMRAVSVVADALAEFDPARGADYQASAEAYLTELEALNGYAQRVIGSIPEGQRVLVTAHDAFNYMGRAYGLDVRGIQGLSTESEAGVQDIEQLVAFLVHKRIPAVFVESSVADKNVRALVEGAAAQGHKVVIGGELFSDAMGPSDSYEGTYIGMIDHNVTTIARALGGEAPERGMHGKLSVGRHRQTP